MVAGGAQASTSLTIGSGWQTFTFGGVGSSWSDDYTFTVGVGGAALKVTDGYLGGRPVQRRRRTRGHRPRQHLGNTSVPLGYGQQIGSDWDGAYASPLWSSGRWVFGPGSYDITGTAVLSPFGGGAGAVQLTGVPEPSTWAMMGLGFAGLAFAGFRARRTAVSTA